MARMLLEISTAQRARRRSASPARLFRQPCMNGIRTITFSIEQLVNFVKGNFTDINIFPMGRKSPSLPYLSSNATFRNTCRRV